MRRGRYDGSLTWPDSIPTPGSLTDTGSSGFGVATDLDSADRIGEFWGYPESRAFAELLIDCEEDRTLRAGLVGMLREGDRNA
jgi:hypothetical protein